MSAIHYNSLQYSSAKGSRKRIIAYMTNTLQWWVPVMGQREKELLCEVIDRNFPNDGEYSDRFAAQIAEICGVPYAVTTTSGTAAITMALMACGVGPGDEVIVPDITFIATANAVKLAGATPVLVDVQISDYNISPEAIERAITPRTRAIVPVHVSGRGANMHSVLDIARRHGLRVVEDSAEALGSCLNGQPLGTFGDAGIFSFSANKTITTGQGGVVVARDPDIHFKLKLLKDQGRPVRGTGGDDEHIAVGFNFKFTNLQGAMGLGQLEEFWPRVKHQRLLYEWYLKYMPEHPQLRLVAFHEGEYPQWIDIYVEGKRDSLHDYLLAKDMHTRKFWHPIHTQAPYRQSDEHFEGSMQVSRNALWLPSALTLTESDVQQICAAVEAWLAQE